MAAPSTSTSTPEANASAAGQNNGARLRQLLPQQAQARLTDLLDQLETQIANAVKATGQLTIQIEQKMQQDFSQAAHIYGVFLVGKPRQRMVLRNVTELNGEKPLYTAPDFTSAVQFAGQRLTDPVLRHRLPLNYDALLKDVERLAREIDHIIKVNARISGSGTEADPFVVKEGSLHVLAPITHGFPGVQPDQLILKGRDGLLHVIPIPPPS